MRLQSLLELREVTSGRVPSSMKRLVLMVNSAGYEAAWQCASWGVTAAAMGEEVTFVFAFEALRSLAAGTFGVPLNEREQIEAERGAAVGAALPAQMLAAARELGARVLACDTTVKLCGLDRAELERRGVLDEVQGLPQIWRHASDARLLSV